MHCYRCGTELGERERHLRRKMSTVGWTRHPCPGVTVGVSKSRYGMWVVCGRCAYVTDLSEGRLGLSRISSLRQRSRHSSHSRST